MKRDDHGGDEHDPPQDAARPQSAAKSGHDGGGDGFAGLTPRQGQAVEALLREPTLKRAAAAAGVGARTLRRWMAEEAAFRAALLAAKREAFGQAVALSQRYAPVAVATLVKVMQDDKVPANARITAAAMLLRFGRDGVELDDLLERVAMLERSAWGGGGNPPALPGKADDEDAGHDEEQEP